MAWLLVRHKVRDFAVWKEVFESHSEARAALGCKGGRILRSLDDPDDVTVLLEWESEEGMRAFTARPDLEGTQERAGILGQVLCLFLGEGEPAR